MAVTAQTIGSLGPSHSATRRSMACSRTRAVLHRSSRHVPLRAIKDGDAVTIHYVERLASNDLVVRDSRARKEGEGSDEEGELPLTFIVGKNAVITGLENAVMGMDIGEKKTNVLVGPSDAYGARRDDLTAVIAKDKAPAGMEVGITVGLSNGMTAVVTDEDPEGYTIDANHPLAGKDMSYDVDVVDAVPKEQVKEVYFGAGCFWGPALYFKRLVGVIDTEVGYCNGTVETVTYEDVCSGTTGHNEVVKVLYNEKEVTLGDLVREHILKAHDPTTLNRQGNDSGTQYRSGIYLTSEAEKQEVERMIDELQPEYSGQIVTEVDIVDKYNVAEDYHQAYLEKGGRFGRKQSAAKKCNDPIRCYG
jgi:methionine-S-sulfoxide reductase